MTATTSSSRSGDNRSGDNGSGDNGSGTPGGPTETPDETKAKLSGKQIAARTAVIAAILFCIAMWLYAFVFAADKPLAELDDHSWSQRAKQICDVRNDLLDENAAQALKVSDGSPQMLGVAVRRATDIIEETLGEVVAVRPTSQRDLRLVAQWEKLYRIYIADRRDVEGRLLAGQAVELNETTLNGSPVSLTIGDFTNHNRMPSCSVPSGR